MCSVRFGFDLSSLSGWNGELTNDIGLKDMAHTLENVFFGIFNEDVELYHQIKVLVGKLNVGEKFLYFVLAVFQIVEVGNKLMGRCWDGIQFSYRITGFLG